jgi:probable phosphoglycerate mutase
MTTFLLIRHAATDQVDAVLTGRSEGVHLNREGRAQALALADRLSGFQISALYSSPLERARETAEPIASRLNLEVQLCEEAGEIRFGDWSGRTFEDLNGEKLWRQFNSLRSLTRPPGGELMLEVQARMICLLNRLCDLHLRETVAVVTHGDVIRGTIAHYAGIHLDMAERFEISLASISIIARDEHGPRILRINDIGK